MSVVFMANYFFSERRRHHRQRDALTDFMNLKIKSKLAQYFGGVHIYKVCARIHRSECSYVYEFLSLFRVFLKKASLWPCFSALPNDLVCNITGRAQRFLESRVQSRGSESQEKNLAEWATEQDGKNFFIRVTSVQREMISSLFV
jgi:hypothetical protein